MQFFDWQQIGSVFGAIFALAMMIFFAAAIWARHDERNGR
jgi:hypothetical protein